MERMRSRPYLIAALALAVLVPAPAPAGEPVATRVAEKDVPPPIELIDQDGKPFSMEAGRQGRPVLLTFIFTHCPGPCPYVVEMSLAAARKAVDPKDPGSRPLVVAVSFDPRRDTPEVLRDYMKERRIKPGEAVFLTGDPKKVEEVVLAYGVNVKRSESGDIDHAFQTVVVDRSGRMLARYYGYNIDEDALQKDAKAAARKP
jgi:protein SCO1/2